MLIELIRVIEFIVTCGIVIAGIWTIHKVWARHQLSEAKKKLQLHDQQFRETFGPHGSSATIKGIRKKRTEEEWKL